MPFAVCYLDKEKLKGADFETLVSEWARTIEVSEEDITLNLVTNRAQFGSRFPVVANLYLPSLWSEDQVQIIQETLSSLVEKYLDVESDEIFIMTSIVLSGHVYSNGKAERWNERHR